MSQQSQNPIRAIIRLARFLGMSPLASDWKGVDELMPILEKLRADGAIVMMKLDGERTLGGFRGTHTLSLPFARSLAHVLGRPIAQRK